MKKILIIEDDELFRETLAEKIKSENYEVLSAEDGEQGLKILNDNVDTDLIILDLVMPKMDGETFYYNMRTDLKDTIPVIIFTNLTTTAYPGKAAEFLTKSNTSLEQLMEKIKKHIGE